MASSIIGGLVESGHPAELISAADPFPPSLEKLKAIAAVQVYDNNADAVAGADVIVTACPFCLVNIEDAIKVAGMEGKMEALDLAELVLQHMAKKGEPPAAEA